MKTRLFQLAFFLFLSINQLVSQNIREQDKFVIGTFFDPRITSNTDISNVDSVNKDIASFQLAKDAYFNFLSGVRDDRNVNNSYKTMRYTLHIANRVGLKSMVTDQRFFYVPFDNLSTDELSSIIDDYSSDSLGNLRSAFAGYNIMDEPEFRDSTNIRKWINFFRENDSSKIAYMNLLPIYGFHDTITYDKYLNTFLKSSEENNNPTVVSYDHYRPENNYYYNLAVIKQKSGNKPFWVYPLTNRLINYPVPIGSRVRLEVFAPIAYGAKGVLYFTYNYKDDNKLLIDYGPIDNLGAWNETVYFNLSADENYEVTFGNFDGKNGDDISLKTNTGKWYIDYAENGFGSWDVILNGYGSNDYAKPIVADYDGDELADLSVKTTDGRWLIDYAVDGFVGWASPSIILFNDTMTPNEIEKIKSAIPVPSDYDGDGKADISIMTSDDKWYIDFAYNGYGTWDLILVDQDSNSSIDPKPFPADYDGDGICDLCIRTNDGYWSIDYAYNGFNGWDDILLMQTANLKFGNNRLNKTVMLNDSDIVRQFTFLHHSKENQLQLIPSDNIGKFDINIYDLYGQMHVYQNNLIGEFNMNCSSLLSGVYIFDCDRSAIKFSIQI